MKYTLSGYITVSCYCEVEANSEEEARKLASELPAALGYIGSGNEPDECWLIEEVDGEPEGISIASINP